MGGTNDDSNIIKLSAREHFVCHKLLVKITTGQDKIKLNFALTRFLHLPKRQQPHHSYIITSKQFELSRIACAESARLNQTGRKKSVAERERIGNLFRGKPKSIQQKLKMSVAALTMDKDKRQRQKDSTKIKTTKTIEKMRASALARDPIHNLKIGLGHRGKPKSKESIERLKDTMAKMPKFQCPHCSKCGKISNMKRWHFDNCKNYGAVESGVT